MTLARVGLSRRIQTAQSGSPASDDSDLGDIRHRRFTRVSEIGLAAALILLVTVFAALDPGTFGSSRNIRDLAANASTLVVLSMATTFVIVCGGLDLSLGSVIAFSEVVTAETFKVGDGTGVIILGLAVALLSGTAWGAGNGLLVSRLSLPPFIATLATLGIAEGAAEVISGGNDIAIVPSSLINRIGVGVIAGIPVLVFIAAIIFLAAALILSRTRFGRHTYAIGSDSTAAERSGIAVRTHRFLIYSIAGTAYGLVGFLNLAQFGTTNVGGHASDALNAITAVAIGGASLYGGVGSAFGSLIGVFLPAVLQNGLIIVGVQAFYQQIAVGVALVIAVSADQLRRRAQRLA